MRIVERLGKTYILPFGSDKDGPPFLDYILVEPNGMVRLIGFCGAAMNAASARTLAEALLRAAEIAEGGGVKE